MDKCSKLNKFCYIVAAMPKGASSKIHNIRVISILMFHKPFCILPKSPTSFVVLHPCITSKVLYTFCLPWYAKRCYVDVELFAIPILEEEKRHKHCKTG